MLELAAARMLARTEYVWRDMEDDRLGFAIARTLTRPDLSADQATGWLRPVLADFRAAEPGPMPPHASNTIRTLRVVYLLADRGIQPRGAEGVVPVRCRAEVLAALTDALRLVEPAARLGMCRWR